MSKVEKKVKIVRNRGYSRREGEMSDRESMGGPRRSLEMGLADFEKDVRHVAGC